MREWQKPTPLRERFDAKWMPEPNSGCWLWLAFCNRSGYGQISIGARDEGRRLAHQASWLLFKGPIPSGMDVLHRCDTPACVNPEHLFLGTAADNMADCWNKGRGVPPPVRRGSHHVMAKLTEDQVRKILSSSLPSGTLATAYGVSRSTVKYIRSRRLWRHIA